MKIVASSVSAIPISAAVEVGDLVFVSGQAAYRDGKVVGENVAQQTNAVFNAIEGILVQLGLTLDNIVKTNVWLVDAKLFSEFNAAYAIRLTTPCPARSTVISSLAIPGALVEIDAIASRSSRRS